MSKDNLYLIIYILLWFFACRYYWKKKKVFGAGVFVLSSYLLYSIFSFILYNNFWLGYRFGNLELLPFIYLFVLSLIVLQPVLRYDERNAIQTPSVNLLDTVSYVYIVTALMSLPEILPRLEHGLILILSSSDGGADLYDSSHGGSIKGVTSIASLFLRYFSDIFILFYFYYLTLPQKRRLIIAGGTLCLVVQTLQSFASGQRTTAVMTMLLLLAAFFLLRKHFTQKTSFVIKIVGGFLLSIVILFVLLINASRFSDKTAGEKMYIIEYAGQANLNFNNYGLDAGGIRNGDRTCNSIKRWLQFDNVPNGVIETRTRYSSMKLDDANFSTYIGDFSLDFGPVVAAILLSSISLFICYLAKKRTKHLLFHQLILVFFVLAVTVQGGMYLFYYSFGGNYTILGYLFFYLLFKWDYDKHNSLISHVNQ